GMASLLGLDPLMGLIAGSITLSGGHGTGAAWSKLFVERYGFAPAYWPHGSRRNRHNETRGSARRIAAPVDETAYRMLPGRSDG
ncbi:sodium/glutamate symporter, partial [Salmonella enterica subsp. enterica serovar Montevideo]|nr:sodium/glutamate symporter [Salmonella enterica subsp. enterica serovar Montevideo]